MQQRLWLIPILLYAAFFIIGGALAPVFAHIHWFEHADGLYGLLSASCQQQPTRSFWLMGYPMAICARCLGSYIGFIGAGVYWVRGHFDISKNILLLIWGLVLCEKVMEWTIWPGDNPLRLVSGVFLGVAIMATFKLIVSIVRRVVRYVFPEKNPIHQH